jgi:hypothetical protein
LYGRVEVENARVDVAVENARAAVVLEAAAAQWRRVRK